MAKKKKATPKPAVFKPTDKDKKRIKSKYGKKTA